MPHEIFASCARTAGDLAGVFEHDSESGWFYLFEVRGGEGEKVLAAAKVHVGAPDFGESDILVRWDQLEEKVGLYIRGMLWSVFDVRNNKTYGCQYAVNKAPELPSEATSTFGAPPMPNRP